MQVLRNVRKMPVIGQGVLLILSLQFVAWLGVGIVLVVHGIKVATGS